MKKRSSKSSRKWRTAGKIVIGLAVGALAIYALNTLEKRYREQAKKD